VTTLRRTVQTAAPLAAKLDITPVVEPDLREINLGEWEGGLFRKHTTDGHPIADRLWREQRWDVIPGAESDEAFGARLRAAITRIAAAHPDSRVAVFTHGGVIGEILAQASRAVERFAFLGADNGSISHIVVHDGRWMVRRYNDTAHLAKPLG